MMEGILGLEIWDQMEEDKMVEIRVAQLVEVLQVELLVANHVSLTVLLLQPILRIPMHRISLLLHSVH